MTYPRGKKGCIIFSGDYSARTFSMNESLPILWLHHHTGEPHLLRDGDDGTRISCIYESVASGLKQGDVRIPCMTMDDFGLYQEGADVVLRFRGDQTPADVLATGFRAKLHRVAKSIRLGDLTDDDARVMGYKSVQDLLAAKELRYPIVKRLWEPEELTVAEVRFEVLQKLDGLKI